MFLYFAPTYFYRTIFLHYLIHRVWCLRLIFLIRHTISNGVYIKYRNNYHPSLWTRYSVSPGTPFLMRLPKIPSIGGKGPEKWVVTRAYFLDSSKPLYYTKKRLIYRVDIACTLQAVQFLQLSHFCRVAFRSSFSSLNAWFSFCN